MLELISQVFRSVSAAAITSDQLQLPLHHGQVKRMRAHTCPGQLQLHMACSQLTHSYAYK